MRQTGYDSWKQTDQRGENLERYMEDVHREGEQLLHNRKVRLDVVQQALHGDGTDAHDLFDTLHEVMLELLEPGTLDGKRLAYLQQMKRELDYKAELVAAVLYATKEQRRAMKALGLV